jgi:succinate dehydrogenase/fumarate reductase cytochrome b subunit
MIEATLEQAFDYYTKATMSLFYQFAFLTMVVVIVFGIVYAFYHLPRK